MDAPTRTLTLTRTRTLTRTLTLTLTLTLTSSQALQDARRNLRFLLVYLHSDAGRDSATFLQRVMSSALFSHFVDENFTFWVGDIATLEGRRMRQALRAHLTPSPSPNPSPNPDSSPN